MIKRIRFGVTALVGVVTLIALVVSCGSPTPDPVALNSPLTKSALDASGLV